MTTPTHFNNQEIIDQHLPERLNPAYYEMLETSQENKVNDMNVIRQIASYLRNDKYQRRYSGNKPIGFIITKEHTRNKCATIHFYVEGVYALASHYFKSGVPTASTDGDTAKSHTCPECQKQWPYIADKCPHCGHKVPF